MPLLAWNEKTETCITNNCRLWILQKNPSAGRIKAKRLSALGALRPLTRGSASGPRWGRSPQTPLHARARHMFTPTFQHLLWSMHAQSKNSLEYSLNHSVPTRKHSQSYRHADPCRQRPQVAQVYGILAMITGNRACGFLDRVTLTLDLSTYGSMHAERLL